MKKTKIALAAVTLILTLCFLSCKKPQWQPGSPLPKEKVKIGVLYLIDPSSDTTGYSYTHHTSINKMKIKLGLADNQILYKYNVDDVEPLKIEIAIRSLIANGANIIIATSWGYMDSCEKLAREFPSVVFAHASGYKYNDTNFTNYFGRVYQAHYLAGIVAGAQTKTGKIGHVGAWGKENSEVTGGLNAFAMGVEKANPHAKIYSKVTYNWFDPMGEAVAARALIAAGCDVIAQDCDTANPQIEAEKAGVWGVGYNNDMSADAPLAVLTSVIWNWNVYYAFLVQSVIDGTFTTAPWYGSLKDGIVDISPLNENITWKPETLRLLKEERRRIESGVFDVFNLSDKEIREGINWHHHNIVELR